jgi:hypothetical protein
MPLAIDDKRMPCYGQDGNENEEEDGLLLAPTTHEPLHEGTMTCILTQTLTERFTGMQVEQCANDPSAGSPTETLLRLLLPLSDKVH